MSWVSVLEVFLLKPRCFSAQVEAQERKAPAQQMCLPCCKEKAVVSQPNTFLAAVEQSVLERPGLKKSVLKRRAQPASYGRCRPTEIAHMSQLILKCE